jgi:hypothetical protein
MSPRNEVACGGIADERATTATTRNQVVRVAVAEEEGGAATIPEKAGGTRGRRRDRRRHARPSLGAVCGLVGGSNTWAESASTPSGREKVPA